MKYGKTVEEREWVKVHLICGVKTNVVAVAEIADKNAADAPLLPALVRKAAETFHMAEVTADAGYLSRDNVEAIAAVGADPYIAFKDNSTGGVGGLFAKMYHFYRYRQDDFLKHYHQRSNVESTFSMIKAKFGDSIRSKTDSAMANEALCKILCHNICCLIQSMHELGIDASFGETIGAEPKAEPAGFGTDDDIEALAWM